MITIDQLLESVDLDFEPRFVTKDESGEICIWDSKPYIDGEIWNCGIKEVYQCFGALKLAEFDGKDWTECIYEVPRKTDEYEQNLEKLRPADSDLVYRVNLPRKTTGKIERFTLDDFATVVDVENCVRSVLDSRVFKKLNGLVDAVNELKEKFALPTLNPDLTDEDLRKMMCDPKYWRDKDSATIQKVQNGFNKLYGDKN